MIAATPDLTMPSIETVETASTEPIVPKLLSSTNTLRREKRRTQSFQDPLLQQRENEIKEALEAIKKDNSKLGFADLKQKPNLVSTKNVLYKKANSFATLRKTETDLNVTYPNV
jgi:hypothetical protein